MSHLPSLVSFPSAPSSSSLLQRKPVLSEAGVDGTLHFIGPGAEFVESPADAARARALFVSNGQVTVTRDPINTLVSADEALHLPAETPTRIRNHTSAPAKVLVVTLPAPPPAPVPVITLP